VSNLETAPQETTCGGGGVAVSAPEPEVLAPRDVPLGGPRAMTVRRTLPHRHRRMVGAWCFVDHYGPQSLVGEAGMQVPPHPHTGLQTVSWLLEGEVLHRDSLGNRQRIEPGQLNLMTAGHGIAHAEETPRPAERTTQRLHGVQLWVALPAAARSVAPAFEHHPRLPVLADGGLSVSVVMGSLGGASSPATTFSPLVGADLALAAGTRAELPLEPSFEHAVLVTDGPCVQVQGRAVERARLLYLPPGSSLLALEAQAPARALLVGGEPFAERIVMWWNFVGADHDEVASAREQWQAADPRFGPVHGYRGGRLAAPALPNVRLTARGRTRDA
jgi:redox-sensitive bicupin YhaK (pirin superfamily)